MSTLNTLNTLNLSNFSSIRINKPSLGSKLYELQEITLDPMTWAAGLEMEATYILNHLDMAI